MTYSTVAVMDKTRKAESVAVGRRIARARKKKRLTLEALARSVEVHCTSLWRWEHGKALPPTTRVTKLATALGVSVAWLIDGESTQEQRSEPKQQPTSQLGVYRIPVNDVTWDQVAARMEAWRQSTFATSEQRATGTSGYTARPTDDVGERVRSARIKRGLGLAALAQLAGIDRSTLHRIETGHSRGTGDALVAIARALDVSMDWLIDSNAAEPDRTNRCLGMLAKALEEKGSGAVEAVLQRLLAS